MAWEAPGSAVTLRVSLLEQCQYDCGYCRPGSVVPPSQVSSWLRPADYLRLARVLGTLGVRKVRFTGGEPLLRPDVLDVVRSFRAALPDAALAMTTNGQRLRPLLDDLAAAGLERATVHVDSLRPERYRALMGASAGVGEVLSAVLAAKQRLGGVKLNVVVQRDRNDDELLEFLAWSREHGVEVRFIELMNTGSAAAYTRAVFVSGEEIVATIGRATPVKAVGRRHHADPAALYEAAGVTFGVIASDTQPFCGACDRLRLSADGRLRGCLYEHGGAPLGEALRRGADDAWLRGMVRAALRAKQRLHPSSAPPTHRFSMADTGG